jgi:hypothetical protein
VFLRRFRPLPGLSVLLACSPISTPSSSVPVPVIQGVLVVGEPAHGISITWSVPADSSFEFRGPGRPVTPQEVSLRLLLPGGASLPVVSTDPGTGQFEVLTDILPNTSYALTGTVAGRTIFASVVTPGPFFISLPAGDTVRLVNNGLESRRVPYQWRANGALGYSAKPFAAFVEPASDSTGTIVFGLLESDTTALTFLAFERHATEFFLPNIADRRRGNITGALGALGAASTAKRVFIWQ